MYIPELVPLNKPRAISRGFFSQRAVIARQHHAGLFRSAFAAHQMLGGCPIWRRRRDKEFLDKILGGDDKLVAAILAPDALVSAAFGMVADR